MSFVSKQYTYTPILCVSQTCQARDKYSIISILSQGDLLLANSAVKPLATAK
jgi:hypothetical protein